MRTRRISLVDFCQHARLELNLRPGIIAVLGLNGSGKSNLIRAIYYGLTGENLGAGSLEDLVRWGQPEASVALDLEDGGQGLAVERRIGGSSVHRLSGPQYGKLSRKSEINALLARLLGMSDLRLLSHVVFVRQGELDRLFKVERGERLRVFNQLFQLEEADRLRLLLQEFRGRLILGAARGDELRATGERVGQLAERVLALGRELAGCREKLQGAAGQEAACQAALHGMTQAEAEQKLLQLDMQLEHLLASSRQLGELAKVPEYSPVRAEEHAMAGAKRRHVELVGRVGGLGQRLSALGPEPSSPPEPAPLPEAVARCSDALREFQRRLELARAGKCSTCGRPYVPQAEQLAQWQSGLADCSKRLADASAIQAKWDAYNQAEQRYSAARLPLSALLEEAGRELQKLPEGAPGFDLEAYEKRCQLAQAAEEAARAAQQARSRYEYTIGVAAEVKRSREELAAVVPGLPTAAVREKAAGFLRQLAESREAAHRLEVEQAAADAQLKGLAEMLAKLQQDEERYQAGRRTNELLGGAYDVLHPDRLPRLAAQQARLGLNEAVSKCLSRFQAPFQLVLDEQMDFQCRFGQRMVPVSALSGGQAIVASVALRFALLGMVASGCGMLVLDEPTAYLDHPNKKALLEVLQQVGEQATAAGMTILVPTHDEAVGAVCTEALHL